MNSVLEAIGYYEDEAEERLTRLRELALASVLKTRRQKRNQVSRNMRSPNDPIASLCPPGVAQKFKSNGVNTCSDLINFHGDVPGVDVHKYKSLLKKELRKSIYVHSWRDRVVHIVRSKGHVTRGVVEDLFIDKHQVLLNVRWQHRGKTFRKAVTPVSILCAQVLWFTKDLVSDESSSDDESSAPVKTRLPKFTLDADHITIQSLDEAEKKAVHAVVKETNQLYNCVWL